LSSSFPKSEFFIRKEANTLIQGPDSLDVLDRIVSTKIIDMPDLSRRNVLFCDYNGRICDLGVIYTITGNILISSSNSEKEVTRRKLVDGTSWDEECEILVADEAIFRISIFPTDLDEVAELFGVDLSDIDSGVLFEKDNHLFVKSETKSGITIDILVKFENLENIISILRESLLVEMDSIGWENYRIMHGITEMCDSRGNLPDEMGLSKLVSNDKGCYPGQEIHARLESRGRRIKSLCRLTGDYPVPLGKQNVPGFGTISISTTTFSDGRALALALIKLGNPTPEFIHIGGNNYTIEIMGFP
jgi:folate-binding protein YgfZ